MKKVLFIAYQFPPIAGSGVNRSVQFYKYLIDFGYQPIVVTVDRDTINQTCSSIEEDLCSVIHDEKDIVRLPGYSIQPIVERFMKMKLYRIIWFFFYRYTWEMSLWWAKKNIAKVEKIVLDNDIKIVYTSSSPYSSWVIASELKRRLNLKWVADLRDPFTDGYMWQFPSKLHWNLARKREERYLKQADKIVVNTPEVEKLYNKRGFTSPEKLIVITNGY